MKKLQKKFEISKILFEKYQEAKVQDQINTLKKDIQQIKDKTILAKQKINILNNHVDFLYEKSNIRTIKTSNPIYFKKILDLESFKNKKKTLEVRYKEKDNDDVIVQLKFDNTVSENLMKHHFFNRYRFILLKKGKYNQSNSIKKKNLDQINFKEQVRILNNSIKIEKGMDTQFKNKTPFTYSKNCFMVNKIKTRPCIDEKMAKRTNYERCCKQKQNFDVKDLYKNLWGSLRNQRENILNKNLENAVFKGFESLLNEKKKPVH